MKVIKLKKVKNFKRWDFENLKFTEIFRSSFINLSIDCYDVGKKTPLIYKNRPKGAKEILIPFQGKLKIITKSGKQIINPEKDGLSLVIVDSREQRQFENIGNKQVKVLAIFSPPFDIKEIDHLLKDKS